MSLIHQFLYTTRGLYFLTYVTEKRQVQKPKNYFNVLLVAKIGTIYFLNCNKLALDFCVNFNALEEKDND